MRLSFPLDRRFRVIAFGWFGDETRTALTGAVERLLRAGVAVVVMAGTGDDSWAAAAEEKRNSFREPDSLDPLADIRHRLARPMCGPHRRRLWAVDCERGRAVRFDAGGGVVPVAGPIRASQRGVSPQVIAWIRAQVAAPLAVSGAETLVIATRFAAPLPGGGDRPVLVSVGDSAGAEPEIHLGGGAARARALLAAQASLYAIELPASPTTDASWRLVEQGFVVTREHELESLFAIGNGYVGTRASLAEGSPLSMPATVVAGLFEPQPGTGVPERARLPDWTRVAGMVDGRPVRLDTGENLLHERTLDLRQGVLWREWRFRDRSGRETRIRGLRMVSQANRHLLYQSITITAENYSGRLVVQGALTRASARRTARDDEVALAFESQVETPEAFVTLAPEVERRVEWTDQFELDVEVGKTYRLDRLAAVYTSRDGADPLAAAERHLRSALCEHGAEGVIAAHRHAWLELWRDADVRVHGDPDAQRALRFATYHLLSSANPDDEHSSIGARGLTGSAYKGHVFWETEVLMLPFFILTRPGTARSMLMYRYHNLDAARVRAAGRGLRGALYAWESADTGRDVTPPFLLAPDGQVVPLLVGAQEQHISADVAYGVWSYWQATGDDAFLRDAGADILVETARFWASRVEERDDGRCHIRGVIGPDEYHETVDDNAYTNGMAKWNLERAAEVVARYRDVWTDFWPELCGRLELRASEPESWLAIASRMYTGLDERTGVIEQFRGYFDLEPVDLAAHEPRIAPMDVLLGRERIQQTQIIKQADVVMLLHLLWDHFPPAVREASFRYYEPRTDHGSSLSPPVHAAVAARLGDVGLAERYFRQTAAIDLANNMGNAAGGVHLGALGGLWQAAVFGFAGLTLGDGGPVLRPRLPASWKAMEMSIAWRGRRVHARVSADEPVSWLSAAEEEAG